MEGCCWGLNWWAGGLEEEQRRFMDLCCERGHGNSRGEARDDVGCVSTGLDGSRWWAAGTSERASIRVFLEQIFHKTCCKCEGCALLQHRFGKTEQKAQDVQDRNRLLLLSLLLTMYPGKPGFPGSPSFPGFPWKKELSLTIWSVANGGANHSVLHQSERASGPPAPSSHTCCDFPRVLTQRGLDATPPITYGRRHLLTSLLHHLSKKSQSCSLHFIGRSRSNQAWENSIWIDFPSFCEKAGPSNKHPCSQRSLGFTWVEVKSACRYTCNSICYVHACKSIRRPWRWRAETNKHKCLVIAPTPISK